MGLLDQLLGRGGGTAGTAAASPAPMPVMPQAQAPAQPVGGNPNAPDWAQGLLGKRQSYTAPTPAHGGGTLGGVLGGAWDSLGVDTQTGPGGAALAILDILFGGGKGGQSGAAPAPTQTRPQPTQFDPNAYLQSRGVNLPQIKMPF